MEDIKDIICWEIDGKVFDKHVAEALGITQMNYGTMKKRSRYPYEQIAHFCHERGISMNWLLFRDGTKEVAVCSMAALYML